MYKSFTACLKYVFAITSLIVTANTFATDCYSVSPNFSALGDEYFDLDRIKTLTTTQKDQLVEFNARLAGTWQGIASSSVCKGPESSPRRETKEAELKANIKASDNSQLSVFYELNYVEDRIKKNKSFSWFGNNLLSDLEVSNNSVTFSEKTRFQNRLIESIFSINPSGNALTITFSLYSNSILVSEKIWNMNRVN